MDSKDLKAFNDIKKHLERAVNYVEAMATKIDDILGEGPRKKQSPFYLKKQVDDAKALSGVDRKVVEGHIATLKSVRSDVKAAFKELAPLAHGQVNVDKTFADLEQLRKTYAKAFVSGDRINGLQEEFFFPSLKKDIDRLYDSGSSLPNGSMMAIYKTLPDYFKAYSTAGLVLWPGGKKKK